MRVGPGRCSDCGAQVWWNGRSWGTKDGRTHVHVCGAPMPLAGDTCARSRGHGFDHRSAYALDNAARSKRAGFAA